MYNPNRKNGILITLGIIAVIWITAVLLLFDYDNNTGWINFGFGVIAFLVVVCVIFLYDNNISSRIATENYGPIILLSYVYIAISCLFNSVCAVKGIDNMTLSVILNLVIIGFYVIGIVVSRRGIQDLSVATESIANSIEVNRNIKADVQALVLMNRDEKVAPALKQLKELVEYSDRMGRAGAMQYEDRFLGQVNNIRASIMSNASSDVILQQINEATFTWQQRNANM